MGWQTRQIELPVRFGLYSLEHVLSEKQDFDYVASVDEVNRFLEETKGITDYEELKERLDDIKEKVDDLKDGLDDESPSESYLISLSPEKGGLLQSVTAIFHRDGKRKLDHDTLRESKYFAQILRAHNQRRIFGSDVSDYTFIAEPFNEEAQLVGLVDSAKIPREYQNRVLTAFGQVRNGAPEQRGEFAIVSEERYHPVISRVSGEIKYITTPTGVIVGGAGGAALGAGAGALVVGGGAALIVGGAALVAAAGALVAGAGAVAGVAYGASKGAQIGYNLQDRITGNNK